MKRVDETNGGEGVVNTNQLYEYMLLNSHYSYVTYNIGAIAYTNGCLVT